MHMAERLFDRHPDWLSHTLSEAERQCGQLTMPLPGGGKVRRLGTGLLAIEPEPVSPHAGALILSAGIHGNETAPIELLNELLIDILQRAWHPEIPLLLILGNPPAMAAGKRFVTQNLNRLFLGAHKDQPPSHEVHRAAQLETTCAAFAQQHPGPIHHFDLHTAIRASQREKFALYPHVANRQVRDRELAFLTEAGLGTLLLQHKAATTFAAFSASRLDAESFTLELGRVNPFGDNDLTRLADLRRALKRFITGQPAPDIPPQRWPEQFEVVHEIINTGDSFRFAVADDVANFTSYPPGTLIWSDDTTQYRVGPQPESIVFPNPSVPVGQRVGLLIRPIG